MVIAAIRDWNDVVAIIVSILIIASGFVYSCYLSTEKVTYTEYKVTIDDSVSFNEINDNYEILNQEGKIFTLKDKDD